MIKLTTTIETNRKRFMVRVSTDQSNYTLIKHCDNWLDAWTFAQAIEHKFNGIRITAETKVSNKIGVTK